MPKMAVSVLEKIGRSRVSRLERTASTRIMPSASAWRVRATSRIVLFTTRPSTMMKPIIVSRSSGWNTNSPRMPQRRHAAHHAERQRDGRDGRIPDRFEQCRHDQEQDQHREPEILAHVPQRIVEMVGGGAVVDGSVWRAAACGSAARSRCLIVFHRIPQRHAARRLEVDRECPAPAVEAIDAAGRQACAACAPDDRTARRCCSALRQASSSSACGRIDRSATSGSERAVSRRHSAGRHSVLRRTSARCCRRRRGSSRLRQWSDRRASASIAADRIRATGCVLTTASGNSSVSSCQPFLRGQRAWRPDRWTEC